MVEIDRCGWCEHYKGKKDGWLPICEAYPDGIHAKDNVSVIEGEMCNGTIGFSVKPEKRKKYDSIFR